MRTDNQVLVDSKSFVLRVIQLYKFLREETQVYVVSKQVLRSGISIGTNVRESVNARRRMDFINKLNIALKEAIEAAGVHAVDSQEALFEVADIVSLHIPATAETRLSINYALVNKLPKGGILVNTARKEVINEPELLQLLADRADLKYVADIKPDADAEFAQFEGRYFATPKKMGAQTTEANTNAGIAAARQINAFFKEGCTKFKVN